MKISNLAHLAFAISVTAVANPRFVSVGQAVTVREELAAGQHVPETAEDIWGDLTGDNNCLGCQVRFDLPGTCPYEELASDLGREFY